MDMGDFDYHLFELDGEPVAGMIQLTPDMQGQGAMRCWMTYVAVADADASLTDGGTDIPGKRRFSVVVDPTE